MEDSVKRGDATKDWALDQGILWKYLKLREFPKENDDWKMVIPNSLRKQALKECHDDPVSGYFGIKKTMFRARQKYFWTSLIKDVKDYVRKCVIPAQATK